MFKNDVDSYEKLKKIMNKIDKIFNNFENQVCLNCKFFHQDYLCLEIGNGDFKPKKTFGCNHFEKKVK